MLVSVFLAGCAKSVETCFRVLSVVTLFVWRRSTFSRSVAEQVIVQMLAADRSASSTACEFGCGGGGGGLLTSGGGTRLDSMTSLVCCRERKRRTVRSETRVLGIELAAVKRP